MHQQFRPQPAHRFHGLEIGRSPVRPLDTLHPCVLLADRAVDPNANRNRILLTAPLFALILFASGAALFNYQKASSSVITSLLYSLRTHPLAREHLGGEIRISGPVPGIPVPWIWGTIDALHGRVDVRFTVSGKRGGGDVEFKAERVGGRSGKFVTEKFVLVREGKVVDLLGGEGLDPMDGGEPVKKSAA